MTNSQTCLVVLRYKWISTASSDGTIRVTIPGTDSVFAPSYSCTLRSAAAVPNVITNHAGAMRGPFAP